MTTGKAGLAAAPRNRRRYFLRNSRPEQLFITGNAPQKVGSLRGGKGVSVCLPSSAQEPVIIVPVGKRQQYAQEPINAPPACKRQQYRCRLAARLRSTFARYGGVRSCTDKYGATQAGKCPCQLSVCYRLLPLSRNKQNPGRLLSNGGYGGAAPVKAVRPLTGPLHHTRRMSREPVSDSLTRDCPQCATVITSYL